MEMIITDNEAAREAIKRAADGANLSLTRLSELTGLSMGSLGRFVSGGYRKSGKDVQNTNLHLLSFIRALDGAGYEVVVRPKVTGSRRERRMRALKERANGREVSPSS